MAAAAQEPYLKYALFCRSTEQADDGDLSLNGVVDLVELAEPEDSEEPNRDPVLAQVDLNLAFCVGPGPRRGSTTSLWPSRHQAFPWIPHLPRRLNGTKVFSSSDGSRAFASRYNGPESTPQPSSSTAPRWVRPVSWSASSRGNRFNATINYL